MESEIFINKKVNIGLTSVCFQRKYLSTECPESVKYVWKVLYDEGRNRISRRMNLSVRKMSSCF